MKSKNTPSNGKTPAAAPL